MTMTKLTLAPVPAFMAALCMAATPSAAADIDTVRSQSFAHVVPGDFAWSAGDETYANHRRYRYRRNRVDAGDIIAGALILGGIAAVASAANRENDRDYRRYPDPRSSSPYAPDSARGIDRAVSMCVREIERDVRVAQVDGVDRTGEGWRVTGQLYNGDGFACRIGNDGRIDDIDYSGSGARWDEDEDFDGRFGASVQDNQYDDARYREAWADIDARNAAVGQSDEAPMPSYPGGPVDGDLEEDQIGTGYPGAGN